MAVGLVDHPSIRVAEHLRGQPHIAAAGSERVRRRRVAEVVTTHRAHLVDVTLDRVPSGPRGKVLPAPTREQPISGRCRSQVPTDWKGREVGVESSEWLAHRLLCGLNEKSEGYLK